VGLALRRVKGEKGGHRSRQRKQFEKGPKEGKNVTDLRNWPVL